MLIIASLIFYGWFRWSYLAIIIFFIVFNHALPFVAQSVRERWRLWVIRGGIAVDLGILAFFKYSIFILENVTALTGINFAFQGVVLPIGISFFTFQCIMFVADHKHTRPDVSLRDFALYITFFPQLIAGPIVRPWVLLPQIKTGVTDGSASSSAWAAGIMLIAIGVLKKVAIADQLAPYADTVFTKVIHQGMVTSLEAWVVALAFTLQIYFDFSAYSDIALGLALCFGMHLMLNFNSPYKAGSIIEFWHR